ncbi:serine/threonine protein kinase [Nannizzia gypsea CBS 118893]|uniref:Serine/threonine protein kinase n=1 Tax=Arthroderma gypseum (strain ATCC MYA-4604 / CBS 118893) TaxID=535722 RepID=E4V1L2_ARTGP|nr:serine/threonine protein kinase [Nannizzia gypsea CBS 118893]EFR03927.1 serine/threonine protein kinase [Nannizzia gypsea CBS 118893]
MFPKRILKHRVIHEHALFTLHGYFADWLGADIKPSNVLVNYRQENKEGSRFSDVQLADFGSTVHKDSDYARRGDPIGTAIFRNPEAQLEMTWDTSTDIWSFGTMLISLLYGERFHIFKPDVPVDHEDYDLKILVKNYRCFGPFPVSYEEIADAQRLGVLMWIMENTPKHTLKPFQYTTSREICQEDKEFVLRIMKLDPRDRPTAHQLLEDEWFHQV